MKKVEAILTPHKLDAVRQLLMRHGCQEIMVSEVKSSESRNGDTPRYPGVNYVTDLLPMVKLEAVLCDAEAMPTVQEILRVSRSSSSSDETISVGPLEQVVSIGISKPDCYPPWRFANRR